MNGPICACFEYVGDNPYCPVHGKGAKAPEVSWKQMLVMRRSSSAGKVIVTLCEADQVAENGRDSEDPNAPDVQNAPKAVPLGVVCRKCGKGEVHVHKGGRMCGCVECHQLFRYPSMVEVG